jgi:3-mercaptopyruvate sulfurtransferase SseA
MLKRVRDGSLLAIAVCVLLAQPAAAAEATRRHLVDADWLATNLGRADVLVLDASPAQIFAAKHIPGAVSVDFLTYGYPERPLADMEQRYQSWGVSPGMTLVLYDQGGTFMATRLFFALVHHGYPPDGLRILDGGLAKWEAGGQSVTKDATPARPRGTFRIQKVNEDVRVRLPEFLAASGDSANNVLLEALGPETHFGETGFFNRAGHVPRAVMLPSADFFNPDKTFKSSAEIGKILAYLGIRPEQAVHTHCGGGVAASAPFFALKFLLDYPRVTLYQESQLGWLADERELPFWTYDAPFLLREGPWVQAWTGQRLRAFRGSDVSLIDVRPSTSYGEGHLPFALSVPAEVFRAHVARPHDLAKVLGPAGVDPSHEAVIVSGAGVTREAALAFVMLETVGQKKVSVLLDSMEKWAGRGFPVTKDATVVGAPTAPGVLAIAPVTYAATPRRGPLIDDPASTQGAFPKVFIASGEAVPAKAREGKVVHVPYTSLLDADGTPKAAKDIWAILSKAGVPRYAELVCYADDPGEAAVNYLVLRLMGFPDVKVLVR